MFVDHRNDDKDLKDETCLSFVASTPFEIGERPFLLLLREHQKLQSMVQQLHETHTAHVDRCHNELKVLFGRQPIQDMSHMQHSDIEIVNDAFFVETGSIGVDKVASGAYLSAANTRGHLESFGSAASHITTEDMKDRRQRKIHDTYQDLKRRGNAGVSKRVRKNFSQMRRFLLSFFSRRYLKLEILRDFVSGTPFITFFATLIVLNAMFIGFATNSELQDAFDQNLGRNPVGNMQADVLGVIDIVFTGMFCVEVFLRMVALEFRFFFSAEWKWNLLDLVLVMISVIETILANSSLQLSHIRVLRLFKVFRTLRVVREVPFLSRLRMMMSAIASSVASLVWAIVLLFFTIFMFSCVFLQGATQYILNDIEFSDSNITFLAEFFPNMQLTMLTLFMTTTGGINWWDVEGVLLDIGWVYGALFVVYIAIMILALLNIVTGIFLNDALEMAANDREIQKKNQKEKRMEIADELRSMFHMLDTDASGTITFEEFESFMVAPGVAAIFAVFGLDVQDTVLFFDALDVDEDRELGIEEFVMGCIQLRGQAKTVDLVTHMRENKKIMQRITASARNTEAQLQDLRQKVLSLASIRMQDLVTSNGLGHFQPLEAELHPSMKMDLGSELP